MQEITLRRADQSDVPAVLRIMEAARNAMAEPENFITDPEDYVRAHVEAEGFILLAEIDSTPVGFFMTVLPGYIIGNTGYQVEFLGERLERTAILDSVAVLPEHQGKGIMEQLLRACVAQLRPYADLIIETVAPGNGPSMYVNRKCGLRPMKKIRKPSGQERYLMALDLRDESYVSEI